MSSRVTFAKVQATFGRLSFLKRGQALGKGKGGEK
jgi:hypothetical protein